MNPSHVRGNEVGYNGQEHRIYGAPLSDASRLPPQDPQHSRDQVLLQPQQIGWRLTRSTPVILPLAVGRDGPRLPLDCISPGSLEPIHRATSCFKSAIFFTQARPDCGRQMLHEITCHWLVCLAAEAASVRTMWATPLIRLPCFRQARPQMGRHLMRMAVPSSLVCTV